MAGRSHRDDDVTRVVRLVPRPPLRQGLGPVAGAPVTSSFATLHCEMSGQADTLVAERQQSPAAFGHGGRLSEEAAFGRRECGGRGSRGM